MSTWLEPTNRQLSRSVGNTMVLCWEREAQHHIASTAKARVGSRHSGFFTIRMWLPSTEHVNTRANRSSIAQLMH